MYYFTTKLNIKHNFEGMVDVRPLKKSFEYDYSFANVKRKLCPASILN